MPSQVQRKERKSMDDNHVDHFIAVSYLYFLITNKNSTNVSREELEELIIAFYETNEVGGQIDSYLV
jgi:hypothetical protein